MSALRAIMPKIDFEMSDIPYETLLKLEITMDNFLEAMKEIEPSPSGRYLWRSRT